MSRGTLTDGVKALSKELMGYEIDVTELRLMPYVQYCLMNNDNIDPQHVNRDDRDAFAKWREKGWIADMSTDLSVSSEFYDIMCKILKLGYVVACDRISD